jgi:hypothetical protein
LSKIKRRRAVTSVEGEQFVHRELWRVVERQMDHAKANPTGRFYDNLVAMVFAFLSLEAYLNFAGARLDPDYWKNERAHFAKTGFDGKLKKVLALVAVHHQAGKRPFTTLQQLSALRDLVAHGKTMPIKRRIRHALGDPPLLDRAPLTDLVTERRTAIAVADVRNLAQKIHVGGKKAMAHDSWWGDGPFGGITMHVGGGTTVEDEG